MAPSTDEMVRELYDRSLISDTLYRYASTIDTKDYERLRTLFVDDAEARYAGGEWLRGGDTITTWIADHSRDRSWQHHLLSVFHIDLEGDEAGALVYHTSHQTRPESPDRVDVLVARYRDRLRRVDDGWRISRLEMDVGWRETRVA
jgi:3-phenylpropionate/cinnamic acid dioxygenase small subunit